MCQLAQKLSSPPPPPLLSLLLRRQQQRDSPYQPNHSSSAFVSGR
jgi:hypothetical protein